jgi:hypothetical protein
MKLLASGDPVVSGPRLSSMKLLASGLQTEEAETTALFAPSTLPELAVTAE